MTNRMISIAWPAFLSACALESLVFAFVDPLELHWAGQHLGWSRQAVYTAAFFSFWTVCMGACALSTFLRSPSLRDLRCAFSARHGSE